MHDQQHDTLDEAFPPPSDILSAENHILAFSYSNDMLGDSPTCDSSQVYSP